MKPHVLTLDSEALEEFRGKLNIALAIMVRSMKEKHLMEGTTTARIKVLLNEEVNEDTGEISWTMRLEPEIDIKIGAKHKLECEQKNNICEKFDEAGRAIIASNQISIDELLEAEPQEAPQPAKKGGRKK